MTLPSGTGEVDAGPGETEGEAATTNATALSLSPAQSVAVAQRLPDESPGEETGGGEEEQAPKRGDTKPEAEPPVAPSWPRLSLGTDEALERFNRDHPELSPARSDAPPESHPTGGQGAVPAPAQEDPPPGQGASASRDRRLETIDRALEDFDRRAGATDQEFHDMAIGPVGLADPTIRSEPVRERACDFSAALALAATVASEFYFRSTDRNARARPRLAAARDPVGVHSQA